MLFKNLALPRGQPAQDSTISSHLSLFVRRNRFLKNSAKRGEAKGADKPKAKIQASEIRRLLGLAKEERYKIAGECCDETSCLVL